jgi:uncharacterized protein
VVAFFVVAIAVLIILQIFALPAVFRVFNLHGRTLNAPAFLVQEIIETVAVIVATGLLARLERRRIDSFGLPVRLAFGGRFWEGVALGFAGAGLVAVAMLAMKGMIIQGIALHGTELIVELVLWLVVMLLVGLNEEYLFRGYPLQALSRGLGFWPAAVLLSLFFGAAHLTKSGENAIDITNIVLIGLLLCLTLQRTGTLWLAVGFHFAFDFMQFFVIGTRNGGATPVGHLLDATFPGPAWVNGGALGTEASYFLLPVIALLCLYMLIRYPTARPLET